MQDNPFHPPGSFGDIWRCPCPARCGHHEAVRGPGEAVDRTASRRRCGATAPGRAGSGLDIRGRPVTLSRDGRPEFAEHVELTRPSPARHAIISDVLPRWIGGNNVNFGRLSRITPLASVGPRW